jgi:hypothetical protein
MPLIVNGTAVNKISGPASIYILKPKPNKLFHNLPIYMLFGDYHDSNENLCEEDKSPGTMDVYSIQFLSLLNKLSTPEEPIDFFIENADIHNQQNTRPENFDITYPLGKLAKLSFECGKKSPDKTKCRDIKNIRWHNSDIRTFYLKKNKIQPFIRGCTYTSFFHTVSQFKKEFDKNPTTKENFSLLLNHYIREFIKYYGYGCVRNLIEVQPFDMFYKDKLEKEILSDESIIMKQLIHMNSTDKGTIVSYIKQYITNIQILYDQASPSIIMFSYIMNIVKHLLEQRPDNMFINESYTYIYLNRDKLINSLSALLQKESILLDLYTFCRSLKYSKNILPTKKHPLPILDICYFGDAHATNIAYFLINITGMYDIELYSKSTTDSKGRINRCITIKENIDLDDIVNNLKEERLRNRSVHSKQIVAPIDDDEDDDDDDDKPINRRRIVAPIDDDDEDDKPINSRRIVAPIDDEI